MSLRSSILSQLMKRVLTHVYFILLELGPNVDFFTLQELENLVKKFKEGGAQSQPEGEKREGDLLFENKEIVSVRYSKD